MIQFTNVSYYYKTKTYYKKALNNVSFNIEKNDFVLVTGESGGGKSTLGKIISGQVKDYEGNFTVNGIKVTPQFFENVEYIFSKHHLIPQFTVLENLLHRTTDEAEIDDWLQSAGLIKKKHTKLKNLSGGEIQRVSVIASFMTKKEVIVADEPTQGLDAKNAKHIAELFLKVKNKTIIYITHETDSIHSNINRSFFIKNGKLEEKTLEKPNNLIDEKPTEKLKPKLNVFTQIKRMPYLFLLNCISFVLALSLMISSMAGLSILTNENRTENEHFSPFYENRLLITKKDGSSFSPADKLKLENYSGNVVYNDIFLDGYMKFSFQNKNLDGSIYIPKTTEQTILLGNPVEHENEVLMAIQKEELAELTPLLNQEVSFAFDYVGIQDYSETLKIVGFVDKEALSLQASRFYILSNELIETLQVESKYNNLLVQVFVNNTLMATYNQARIEILIDNTLPDNQITVPFATSETTAEIRAIKGSELVSRQVSIINGSVFKLNQTTLNLLLDGIGDHQASLLYVNNVSNTISSLEKQGFMVEVINRDYGIITVYLVLLITSLLIFGLFIGLDMKVTSRIEKSLLWHGISYKNRFIRKIMYYMISVLPAIIASVIILNVLSNKEELIYRFLFGWINLESMFALFITSIVGIIFTTSMYMLQHKKAVKL